MNVTGVLLFLQLGSEHGEGSLDERADQYDGSVEGTASSLKAISVSSNDHTDLVVGVPVAVEQLVPSEPALGVPVDAPSTQAPTLPPQELFFGTASGILRPAAAPPAPSSQAADSKSPAAGDHQPPSATPKPVSATPAEPLPVANAWRKPLQGTPSATKPSPSPDAQAPRAAAGAATLDQASVAAVTGAVPADSGRGGRGRGRGARGRDRDAMPRESRELQGDFTLPKFSVYVHESPAGEALHGIPLEVLRIAILLAFFMQLHFAWNTSWLRDRLCNSNGCL